MDLDNDNPEAERKFQVWTATTTGHLLDSMVTEEGSESFKVIQINKEFFVAKICDTIDPFLRSREGGHAQELLRILDNAIALDKEISRQVARVEWVFPGKGGESVYDPATMELEKGEEPYKTNQEIVLAISPALKKRGKSTGEDFKLENLLLPLEVSCEQVVDSKSRGFGRG
jgi:hypothetical protein